MCSRISCIPSSRSTIVIATAVLIMPLHREPVHPRVTSIEKRLLAQARLAAFTHVPHYEENPITVLEVVGGELLPPKPPQKHLLEELMAQARG